MTDAQQLMSSIAKTSFRLNGRILQLGEELARQAGLSAASWQVLGAILRQPLSVAEVAREIGVTRQSVQRVANLLVGQRLAEFRSNPAHRRSKLLAPTIAGREAVRRIAPAHAVYAQRLTAAFGTDQLHESLEVIVRLSAAFGSLLGSEAEHEEPTERWVVADVPG